MKLVIYRTFGKVGGGYRWRLVADNGRILANGGQGYSRRIDMEHAIESVMGGRLIKRRSTAAAGSLEFIRVAGPGEIVVEDRTRGTR